MTGRSLRKTVDEIINNFNGRTFILLGCKAEARKVVEAVKQRLKYNRSRGHLKSVNIKFTILPTDFEEIEETEPFIWDSMRNGEILLIAEHDKENLHD